MRNLQAILYSENTAKHPNSQFSLTKAKTPVSMKPKKHCRCRFLSKNVKKYRKYQCISYHESDIDHTN